MPACLGGIDLAIPYYLMGTSIVYLLLTAWGGRPLDGSPSALKDSRPLAEIQPANSTTKGPILADLAVEAIKEVHSLGVLHTDAVEMNMLRNCVKEDECQGASLMKPHLEETQRTRSGLTRRNPIPMVLVGEGEGTYELLKESKHLGVKRRYPKMAQVVLISNMVVL